MNKQEIEKAIEILQQDKISFETVNHGGFDRKIKSFDIAIYVLQQQLNNGWIPVKSRLPEEGTTVLASISKKYAGKSTVVIQTYSERLDYWKDGTILAWQPLPPEYQEVSE
jgi:hypothetical protein